MTTAVQEVLCGRMDPAYKARCDENYVKLFATTNIDDLMAVHLIPLEVIRSPHGVMMFPGMSPAREVGKVSKLDIPGPQGTIPIVIYTPKIGEHEDELLPILIHFHGGGWTVGDLSMDAGISSTYCLDAHCIVVSVDYRLAPEHVFPAAVVDAYAVLEWVSQHAIEFGGDKGRIAVGGESAGGNLSAVVSLMARDAGLKGIVLQLLTVPVVDNTVSDKTPNCPYRSWLENGAVGSILTYDTMRWFQEMYHGKEMKGADDWRASPILAEDLSNLPPAFVVVAELDILRDEGIAYAKRLREAGNQVELKEYLKCPHVFTMLDQLPLSQQFLKDTTNALKEAFAKNIK